jgi:hypothetical protein
LINDWFRESGDTLLARLLKGGMGKMPGKMKMKEAKDVGDVPFQSGLVNGKGRAPGKTKPPLAVVEVKKGENHSAAAHQWLLDLRPPLPDRRPPAESHRH